MKFRHFICIVFVTLLASCIGPRRIDKWIDKHYDGSVPVAVKSKSDIVTFRSNVADMGDKISVTEKKTSNMLPLLVYWQWDYKNTSTLNSKIPMNAFMAAVNNNINKGLKQKLNTQRLELTVEKMPTAFSLDDKEHIIWLLYGIHWNKITIQPEKTELLVSYKVLNADNSVAKSGSVSVVNTDQDIQPGLFRSLKKATWQYLDDYNNNMSAMTKRFIDKLILEI